MKKDKIASNLEEILLAIQEIEEFKSEINARTDSRIRLMATRAIERKFELITNCWRNIKQYDPYMSCDNISYFIKAANRLTSAYLGKSSPELIWSVVETKTHLLKDEINELLKEIS